MLNQAVILIIVVHNLIIMITFKIWIIISTELLPSHSYSIASTTYVKAHGYVSLLSLYVRIM